MKIAPQRNDTSNKGKQPPLIPLVPTSHVEELDKENSTSFSLRTNQADADSLVLLALLLGNVLRMSTSTTSTPRT